MTPADTQRGEQIVATMRAKLSKYEDYKPQSPTATCLTWSRCRRTFTISPIAQRRPPSTWATSISRARFSLYEKKTFGGYKLVGAMYDAPAADTPEQLER